MANYPTSDPSFASKSAGQVIQPSHVNALQDEVVAIGSALRGTLAHDLTVNGRVVFPASQNASSDANTLDDYEESTWTPSLGGSATYTIQTGTYTKVGNLVTVRGNLTVNVIGTGSTGVISGLPYAPANQTAGSIGYFTAAAGSFVWVGILASTGAATLTISGLAAAGTGATIPATFFGNGTNIQFSVTYTV